MPNLLSRFFFWLVLGGGLCLAATSLVLGRPASAQDLASLIVLTGAQGHYPLGPALEILEDPTGQLTIADVTATPYVTRFASNSKETPNFGFTTSAYWVRFRVQNDDHNQVDWLLEVALPGMNFAELYLPQVAGFTVERVGFLLPFAEREVPHPNPTFRLPLTPGSEYTVYLRFQTGGAMVLPLIIWSPLAFAEKYQTEQLIAGLVYGAVLIVLGFNLFLAVFLRDSNYLFLTTTIAARLLVFAISQDGRAGQYFWPHSPDWNRWLAPLAIGGLLLSSLWFTRSFLEMPHRTPTLHRLLLLLLAISGGLTTLIPFIPFSLSVRLLLLYYLLIPPFTFTVAFVVWHRGYLPARFFLLASLVIVVQNVGEILVRFNILPGAGFLNAPFGIVLWVFLWSLAQADRINVFRIGIERANHGLQASEARYAQLNVELEQRVVQRTTELARSEAQLRQQNEFLTALQETTFDLLRRLELLPLLEAIVARAATLMGTTHGQISLLEPGGTVMQERVGIGSARQFVGDRSPWGEGLTGQVWQTGQPLVVEDYATWAGRKLGHPYDHFHTSVGVPLFSQAQVVGVLNLAYEEVRFISAEEIVLLQRFAHLASIALENARLFEAERDQRTQTETLLAREQRLNEVARAVSSVLDLPTILSTVVRLTVELLGAEGGSMSLLASDRQSFTNSYLFNLPSVLANAPVSRGRGVSWEVMDSGQPLRLENYALHPAALPEWIAVGVRAYLSAPILAGETCFGELDVCGLSPAKHFSDYDLKLVEAIARQTGVAIQNAHLFETTQRHTDELREAQLKYQTLAEQIPAITYIDTPDEASLAIYISPQIVPLLGYTLAEWENDALLWHKLVHPDDYQRAVAVIQTTLTHGRAMAEYRLKARDGRVVWVRDESLLIHDGQGQPRWVQGLLVDITESRQTETVLRRQNEYFAALHQMTLDLLNRREVADLLRILVERATEMLDAPYGELMLVEADELVVRACSPNQPFVEGERIKRGAAHLSWQAYDTQQLVCLEDYSTWAGRSPVYDALQLHAVADFPILAGPHCLGVLAMGRDEPAYPFDAEQLRAGTALAQLAALTLDNAQLAHSVRVQKELFEKLVTVARATIEQPDLETTLQNVVKIAVALTGATNGSLFLLDETGQATHGLFARGDTPTFQQQRALLNQIMDKGIAGWVARHRQAALIPDTEHDDRWLTLPDQPYAARAVVSLPILHQRRILGILTLVHPTPRHFAEDHLYLLEAATDQMALSLRNAQMYQAQQRLTNRQIALYSVLSAVSSEHAPLAIAKMAVELLTLMLDWPDLAVLLPNDSGEAWVTVAGSGLHQPTLGFSIPREAGITGRAFRTGQVQVVPDVHADPDYLAPITMNSIQSQVVAPIQHRERALGALVISSQFPNAFDAEDATLIKSLAGALALALDNAQLYQSVSDERSRLRALIESTRDGVILVSQDARVLVVNVAALELLSLPGLPEEWLQQSLPAALVAHRRAAPEATRAILAELRRTQQVGDRTSDGEVTVLSRILRWLNLPVRTGETFLGQLLVLRDVTQERQLETMRHDLTDMMVHDLRNPLNVILNVVEAVADTQTPPPDLLREEMLALGKHAADQMLNLVNTILDVSRLEDGQMPLEREFVLLPTLASDIIRLQTPLAKDKGLRLENACPSDVPPVWADARLIQRALQNLVSNAIKFTPAGGTVRLSGKVTSEMMTGRAQLLVTVNDTGRGIPEEIRSRLFQRFVTGRQAQRGSGLGLAFCKLVVEAHGGRIWAESKPSEGTTFCFTLPLDVKPAG